MAILKIESPKGKYKDEEIYKDSIKYILKKESINRKLYFSSGLHYLNAAKEMHDLTKDYHKDFGTRIRHTILSFAPEEETDPEHVKLVGKNVFSFYDGEYQYIAAVHTDTDHLHIHVIMNTVNLRTGKKYGGTKSEYFDFFDYAKYVLHQYGFGLKSCKYE